uniref:DH domain-containing protein n=1 Tax=Anolis carolinensis TaxID=28377 RepID=A0A803TAB9_ANOCA
MGGCQQMPCAIGYISKEGMGKSRSEYSLSKKSYHRVTWRHIDTHMFSVFKWLNDLMPFFINMLAEGYFVLFCFLLVCLFSKTNYFCYFAEKMAPQAGSSGPIGSPLENEEELNRRMMARRQKIIAEMVQTERDYLNDLELCIRIVVEPLRKKQITRFDVDGLFSNIKSLHQISTKLLSLLEEATTDVEPAMQVIGMFAVCFELSETSRNQTDGNKTPICLNPLLLC